MDKKTGMVIVILIGLGSALPIWIFGMCYDLAPFNKYVGVFWMCFLPLAIYYSAEHPQLKSVLNMICSFVLGLGWGYLGVNLRPCLKCTANCRLLL